ncbi:hypothetical protein ACS0TY_020667 [Phlomoides rotata]
MKLEIKTWKDNSLGNLDRSIERKKEEIHNLDIFDDTFSLDEDDAGRRSTLMRDLLMDLKWKDASLFQKSRANWITEGDCNSKIFNSFINKRNKTNENNGVWNSGNWIDSVIGVKGVIFSHFKKHFSSAVTNRPKFPSALCTHHLNEFDNSSLTAPFSSAEFSAAIEGCNPNGSPGPDGFTSRFFKSFWHITQLDFMCMANDFHVNEKILKPYAIFHELHPQFTILPPPPPHLGLELEKLFLLCKTSLGDSIN